MKRVVLCWLLLALSVALAACGFHLRGLGGVDRPLPFNMLYLETGSYAIGNDLRQVLARDQRVQLLPSAQQTQATVSLLSENQAKDILTLNVGGKINEFQLTYTATVRTVLYGVPVEPDMVVTVRRSMNYSDSAILGKEQEENLLWADARRDAAEQIVRRLSFLTKPANAPISGPQSVKPVDASPQR
ncbi:LPS assembly lipoprotein LptE [Neisseriaceae bacterium TC5R-5]|nr:LPS assembly lipoprotein LptE [Neisseriaceae bacterium TC5R-5]